MFEATHDIPWIQQTTFGREACAQVVCPICAYAYQHHDGVREFVRLTGEDGPSAVGAPGVAGWELTEDNPSSRRGAIEITFDGECGHRWKLAFVQHKGETFVVTRESTDEVDA